MENVFLVSNQLFLTWEQTVKKQRKKSKKIISDIGRERRGKLNLTRTYRYSPRKKTVTGFCLERLG